LNRYRKKFEAIDKELFYILPRKLLLNSQKYGLGIRDPEKTCSRIQRCGSRSGIRDGKKSRPGSLNSLVLIRILDPGCNTPRISDRGIRKVLDPGSGFATLP
jgi:hypothetical protein